MSDKRPTSPMSLALKAREARLRRGVEEMQWQLRRFRRTMQKISEPTTARPADKTAPDLPDQSVS